MVIAGDKYNKHHETVDPLIHDQENENFENFYSNFEVTQETECGIWIIRGSFLQKLASKKMFAILYGLSTCLHSAAFSYFNGTISTIEKVLKVSSKTMGLISSTSNICQMVLTIIMSYYVSKKHKPRWLAIGLMTTVLFSFCNVLPYILYGPSDDSLMLTEEYVSSVGHTFRDVLLEPKSSLLCSTNRTISTVQDCANSQERKVNYVSTLLLVSGQFIAGVGGSVLASIGITYIDDNTKKSSAPLLLGISFFLRLIGPAMGLNIASLCLSYYVAPSLNPTIDRKDPRWIGAWWLGWFILGIPMIFMATAISMFPRHLPRAYARQKYHDMKALAEVDDHGKQKPNESPSWTDFKNTIKRLVTNKVFMINNLASVFFVFSFIPSTMFIPKYLEVQFKLSQTQSKFCIAHIYRMWNISFESSDHQFKIESSSFITVECIMTSLLSFFAILSYTFIGCDDNERSLALMKEYDHSCNISSCGCEFIPYSPICRSNNITFISPCHAGCFNQAIDLNGIKTYNNCSCIPKTNLVQSNHSGPCTVDCTDALYIFMAILAIQKFLNGTLGSTNVLISIRSIDPRDKAVSVGITNLMVSLLAFVPGPLIFGHMFDAACEVWGETCTGKGNCWLYETKQLRRNIFVLAAGFRACTIVFDMIVWYLIKNVHIFDENVK